MKTHEIRSTFLEYFHQRDHVIERSDKLVPGNDPTLLFTSAGMVQFKPYYTGEVPVPYRRATTSQKCLRAGGKANDLDEVGKTSRHMTFFEMLGNFSFGDYFKREAISWAWDLSTTVFKLPPERIWVSVYQEDDEAYDIWAKEIGISESRIVHLGDKDNFWGPAGDTGACGPCSELLWDKGEHIDPNATLENDPHERFMEFWNLVFPQFDQQMDGSRPPLKNRGIDTGMGLERISTLLQHVETVFDIDEVRTIIAATEAMTKIPYAQNPTPYRVIADHIRALSFLIADGVLPANDGRGYVERRLLRRAARFGRELGFDKPFLHEVSHVVVDLMCGQYPELKEKEAQIARVIQTEEQRFQSTLARGMDMLEGILDKLETGQVVPGEELFRLHDTYGFPLDLATDIAEDRGLSVDREGFNRAMKRQREQARNAWAGSGDTGVPPVYRVVHDLFGDTDFIGYDSLTADATVLAVLRDGQQTDTLNAGEKGEIILDKSPFYAESGGQTGDIGIMQSTDGDAHVSGAKSPAGKTIIHQVTITRGLLKPGDMVHACVESTARELTQNHHTTTHLLQAALREVLGDHVHQAGSYVSPERLRFDFTHFEGLDTSTVQDVERLVNQYIRTDSLVHKQTMPLDEAKKQGAIALFGEKYEDMVRVIRVGDISIELCGGTHVSRTGVIGCFTILNESAISAGIRRIEAVCGEPAIQTIQERDRLLTTCARTLNASPTDITHRIHALMEENKRLQHDVAKWKQAAVTGGSTDYMSRIKEVNGIRLLATEVSGQDASDLRSLSDTLRDRLGSGVLVLGSAAEGKKAYLCVAVTKDLTDTIKAGDIIRHLASIVGGGGGGRPDLAQAGGKDPSKLGEAISAAESIVSQLLSGKS